MLAHSRRVGAYIAAEIARAGGWISFARYMELALYAPGLGYYVAGAEKLGAGGDFVTAPEISPLFGRTLARQIAQILAAGGAEILELGAGSGRLAADLLRALDALGELPAGYRILELSADLAARQRRCVQRLGPRLSSRVTWITEVPAALRGVIVANEVLDALPAHLVAWRDDGVFERGVGWTGGRFAWIERPLAHGALLEQALRLNPPAPYLSEINLAAPALVRTLAGALEHGVILSIDYGFGEREYYHPQRASGTLMCHYRHRAHDDPFSLPGLQDITSHVDFSAVARAGIDSGLALLGYTTQAQFLVNLGITGLLSETPAADAAAYLPLAAQAHKLLSPAEMGELFKVIALGRGIDAPLAGFSGGDKSRLL